MSIITESVMDALANATTEELKDLEYFHAQAYAKYNGVSEFTGEKNYPALMAIEEQMTLVKSELNRRENK